MVVKQSKVQSCWRSAAVGWGPKTLLKLGGVTWWKGGPLCSPISPCDAVTNDDHVFGHRWVVRDRLTGGAKILAGFMPD